MDSKNLMNALQRLDKTILANSSIIESYMCKIKDRYSNTKYNEFVEKLNNISVNMHIPKEYESLKPIFVNIGKFFAILHEANNTSETLMIKMLDRMEDDLVTIDNLKKYILEQQDLLRRNNIDIPCFKEWTCSVNSSVTTASAISKRIKMLNEAPKSSESAKKFLESVKTGNLTRVPNSLLKDIAKETGTRIIVKDTENTKIIKH